MIVEDKYNKLEFGRAAFSVLMEDIQRARGRKDKTLLNRLESTAKNLSNLVIPLPGKESKEFYRCYCKAFRKKVPKEQEAIYGLTEAETFCFPALDYGIDFMITREGDFLMGDYYRVVANVFELVDANVLYYRALSQPSRRIIQHHVFKNLVPYVLGDKFTGSLADIFLTDTGVDVLKTIRFGEKNVNAKV